MRREQCGKTPAFGVLNCLKSLSLCVRNEMVCRCFRLRRALMTRSAINAQVIIQGSPWLTGLGPFIQRPRCGAAFTRQGYGLTDSGRPGAIAGTSGINIATDASAASLAQARLDRFALASRAWRLALERYRTRSRFKCCKHQSQHHDWNRQALAL